MKSFASYHPAVLLLYFLAVLLIAMFSVNPVIVTLALLGGALFAATLTDGREKRADLGFYLPLLLLVTITNPLFSHDGVTPLFFLNGNPVTLEAILYGAGLGMTLLAVLLWCKCFHKTLTSEKLLFLFGRVSPRLSLLLSMALRYVPLLKRQAGKVERAQRVMGLYTSDSRFDRLRAKLSVYSALIGWSLENAVEVSRSMRARGYGLKGHTSYANYKFTRRDALLCAVVALTGGLWLAGSLMGYGTFYYYPALCPPDSRAWAIVGYAAFAVLALAPFWIEVEETLRWNYCKSKI